MENTLQSLLQRIPDFRDGVLEILTAAEAALLCSLTGVVLTHQERCRFLHPLKQLGHLQDWAQRKLAQGFRVVLVGRDVERLRRDIEDPIQSWRSEHHPGGYTVWIAIIHPMACFENTHVDDRSAANAVMYGYPQSRRHNEEHLFETDYQPDVHFFPSLLCAGMSDDEALADALRNPFWLMDGPVLNGRSLLLHQVREPLPARYITAGILCSQLVEPEEGKSDAYRTSFLAVGQKHWAGSTLVAETELYDECYWNGTSWLQSPQRFIELSIMSESKRYAVFRIPLTSPEMASTVEHRS